MSREVRLERVLGRVVRDQAGRPVGRIEEMRVARDGRDWVVTHFLLGPVGWRARLSVRGLRLLGATLRGSRHGALKRLRGDALDLSDAESPRLRGPRTT
jgi:hypothetical protein